MQFNTIDKTGNPENTTFSNDLRLFIAHRAELRLHPRLLIAISEGAMFNASRMDIRMFSPLMFLHNYYNFLEAKNAVQLEIEYIITPGLYAYSQLFVDQIQISGEVAGYETCELFPNAFGAMLGLQFIKPTEYGYVSGYAESVLTSTYLYLRRNIPGDEDEACKETLYYTNHYNLDFVQAYNRQGASFIGYRHGPDSFFNTLHLSYEQLDSFRVFGEVIFGIRGEQGLSLEGKEQVVDTGREFLNQILPSGIKEYSLVAGMGGELLLDFIPAKLFSQVHTVHKWNYRNIKSEYFFDVQFVIGAALELNIL